MKDKKDIAIIGAGIGGLVLAYRLLKTGHKATVYEKSSSAGGLLATFDINGQPLERFYHHIFSGDFAALNLMSELGIRHKLLFFRPKTAFFYKGKLTGLSIKDLFFFDQLTLREKIKMVFLTWKLKNTSWQKLPSVGAHQWLKKYYGQKIYDIFWKPLLQNKFGKDFDQIDLRWFWARIATRSTKLGYMDGSFEVLTQSLIDKITELGGKILLDHEVTSIKKNNENFRHDEVIATCAPSILSKMTGEMSAQEYLANICMVLILKHSLSKNYWININDTNCPFVVVIEHTNLYDGANYGGHVVYLSRYCHQNDPIYKLDKSELLKLFFPWIKKINPDCTKSWVIESHLFKENDAQPVAQIGYCENRPDLHTPVKGLYLVSMAQIFPYDRGINHAIMQVDEFMSEFGGHNET